MIKWDNFYFWASLILLGACYYLIFFIYKEKFLFLNSIDAETIFLVTGTLGGAFLGAYFASRFSANQISKQLQHQTNLVEQQKMESSLKYTGIAILELDSLQHIFKTSYAELDSEMKVSEIVNEINYILPIIKNSLEELKFLNLVNVVSYDIYLTIYKLIFRTNHFYLMLESTEKRFSESSNEKISAIPLLEAFNSVISSFNEIKPELEKKYQDEVKSHKEISRLSEKI